MTERAARAFGEWPPIDPDPDPGQDVTRPAVLAAAMGNGPLLDSALAAVADPAVRIDDRAALYAALYQLRRRITRAIDPARHELAEHMVRNDIRRLGPISLSSTSIDAAYPCNDPENWADATVQDALAVLESRADTAPYVRRVPEHLEIDTAALGADCARGMAPALGLLAQLKEHRWRTEAGRSVGLRVAP